MPIGRKAPEPTGLEHTTEQSYRLEDVALLEDLHGALAALHQLRDLFTPET
ncbi:MAG TPA: hypothetical protein VIS99_14280 [Terrimicrobiaceae bacterium]